MSMRFCCDRLASVEKMQVLITSIQHYYVQVLVSVYAVSNFRYRTVLLHSVTAFCRHLATLCHHPTVGGRVESRKKPCGRRAKCQIHYSTGLRYTLFRSSFSSSTRFPNKARTHAVDLPLCLFRSGHLLNSRSSRRWFCRVPGLAHSCQPGPSASGSSAMRPLSVADPTGLTKKKTFGDPSPRPSASMAF
jgi:hypothetical protein